MPSFHRHEPTDLPNIVQSPEITGVRRYFSRTDREALSGIFKRSLGMFGEHSFDFGLGKYSDEVSVVETPTGEIAGFSEVSTAENGHLSLDKLFVDANFNRNGYGSLLLSNVERYAWQQGFNAITLVTSKTSAWGVPFYTKHGFNILARGEMTPFMQEYFDGTTNSPAFQAIPNYLPIVGMIKNIG